MHLVFDVLQVNHWQASQLIWLFKVQSLGHTTIKHGECDPACPFELLICVISTPIATIQRTLTGLASILIFPHETASSGGAPASLPSNDRPVLMKTEKSAPFRMRLALQIWCLTRPPPRINMPVFSA